MKLLSLVFTFIIAIGASIGVGIYVGEIINSPKKPAKEMNLNVNLITSNYTHSFMGFNSAGVSGLNKVILYFDDGQYEIITPTTTTHFTPTKKH